MCKNQAEQLITKGKDVARKFKSKQKEIERLKQEVSKIEISNATDKAANEHSQVEKMQKKRESLEGKLQNLEKELSKETTYLNDVCNKLQTILPKTQNVIKQYRNADRNYSNVDINAVKNAENEINRAVKYAQKGEKTYQSLYENIQFHLSQFNNALNSSGGFGLEKLLAGTKPIDHSKIYIPLTEKYMVKRNYNLESNYSVKPTLEQCQAMLKKPYEYYQNKPYEDYQYKPSPTYKSDSFQMVYPISATSTKYLHKNDNFTIDSWLSKHRYYRI